MTSPGQLSEASISPHRMGGRTRLGLPGLCRAPRSLSPSSITQVFFLILWLSRSSFPEKEGEKGL